MPVIKMEYDNTKVSEEDAKQLAEAAQKIVAEATNIKEVFVYGNSAQIKVLIAPVEIFVEMSDYKVKDLDALTDNIKTKLAAYKKESGFNEPINLTVTPMHWKVVIGI